MYITTIKRRISPLSKLSINELTYLHYSTSVRMGIETLTELECGKKIPLYPIWEIFICFNNNVSNLYNNSVVEKIYGMAYMFTLLMFRKSNKTINKNKTTIFYRSTSFRFSFIFRYFKVFQVSQIFTCGLSDLLLLAVGSLVVLVLREYILKVHIHVSSEHKLCQI